MVDLIAFCGESSGHVDKEKAVDDFYIGFSKVCDRVPKKCFPPNQ